MTDLRPPYPWEPQPTKPKEESGIAIFATVIALLVLFWLYAIAFA